MSSDNTQVSTQPDAFDLIAAIRDMTQQYIFENPDEVDELQKDPKSFLLSHFPDDLTPEILEPISFRIILEDTPNQLLIPVPSQPEDLTEEQLEAVSGGAFFAKAITKGIIGIGKVWAGASKTKKAAVVVTGLTGGTWMGTDIALRAQDKK